MQNTDRLRHISMPSSCSADGPMLSGRQREHCFPQDNRTPLVVQGQQQANGTHYEIVMWYVVPDDYIVFRCYAK
jgi:hypothetical protein